MVELVHEVPAFSVLLTEETLKLKDLKVVGKLCVRKADTTDEMVWILVHERRHVSMGFDVYHLPEM